MATLKAELREILTKYGINPRDKSKLWDCHGTLVLYHRAYEIIAARERITFDQPTVIEANSADKIVALLVTGRMGERSEWSIGEAAPGNCKNAYVYAIAEKRAKDRVIAKLVGLAEYVYSEDEAEEFKNAPRQPVEAETHSPPQSPSQSRTPSQAPTSGQVLRPNPEEPPAVTAARDAARAHFWRRDSYAIDPAVIVGGLAAWDAEMIAQASTAPSLDAYLKMEDDCRPHFDAWAAKMQKPVVELFCRKLGAIHARLAKAEEGRAA